MKLIHKNLTLEISQDADAESPRKWENLGTMACEHGRYKLGDEGIGDSGLFGDDLHPTNEAKKTHLFLPLYLYDHSGITMKTTPFNDRWDSGQVGYIYVSHKNILKNFSASKITNQLLEQAKKALIAEVEVYATYLEGSVYQFVITKTDTVAKDGKTYTNEETVDSCGGYFGHDHKKSGLCDAVAQTSKELAKLI